MRHAATILKGHIVTEWMRTFETMREANSIFEWEPITVGFNALHGVIRA